MRACLGCGGAIPPTRATQARYCTLNCRRKTFRRRHPEKSREWVRQANSRRYQSDLEFRAASRARTKAWRARNRRDPMTNPKDRFRVARAQGYRSGLEVAIAQQLTSLGVPFQYESVRIPFLQPSKARHYTPDIVLSNGIILELKGRMVTADRHKHLLVRQQHPDLDIRLVFSNANTRISKQSKTTYAAWADAKGIPYAHRTVPDAWLREAPNGASLRAIQALTED